MKTLFTLLTVLVIAAFIGIIAYQDNGYVLIGRGASTIEMSLASFIFLQITAYIVIAFVLNLLRRTWSLPDIIKNQHRRSASKKARIHSKRGLIALAQGQWKKAEKALLKNVNNSETPLLNYLSAARAAQKLNEPDRRDHYLALAHKSMPDADFAVELTQAELQLAHGQFEQSLATLVHLRSISPKHSHVLNLLAQLYEKLNSWKDLQALLPDLKKYGAVNKQEIYRLQKITFLHLISEPAISIESLTTTWQSLAKDLKNNHELILAYTKQLIEFNEHERAEHLLRAGIKQQWNTQLVYYYGLLKTKIPQQQLDFAEQQLKQHEHNPILLLTLGRLCLRLELWGKGQSYLEASLGAEPLAETYKELGLLMERLEEKDKASEYFRLGLLLVQDNNRQVNHLPF